MKPSAELCGAMTKQTRRPCRNRAGWKTVHPGEGRCVLHGGGSPRGREHPAFRHGLRSKYGEYDSEDVQAILERLDADEELSSVEGEVLYLTARLVAWIQANKGAWSLETVGAVSIILKRLSSVKQRSQRLQIERGKLLTAESVRAWLVHVQQTLEAFVAPEDRPELRRRLLALPLAAGSGRNEPPPARTQSSTRVSPARQLIAPNAHHRNDLDEAQPGVDTLLE